MRKVLHYKTNFLNNSETFINRLIKNHQTYEPAALCYQKKSFTDGIRIYEVPGNEFSFIRNCLAFHLNFPLPFYKQIIRELKPDIIHAHFGYDAYKMLHIAREQNIPLVTSFYGSDVTRLPSELFWTTRYKKLAAFGAHFIAASDLMKNQLEELGFPAEKISVVRFGLNLKELKFYENKPGSKKILMVGRLVEKKGFEYALMAISHLKRKGIIPEVNIFGDGPLRKKLTDLTEELGISNFVTFHGFKPVEEILKAHGSHSLLLAPSVKASDGDTEGLPNTILEAMAMGTVVVATRHAAIPEVVEHEKTGFLAWERNPEELAEILEKLFSGRYDLKMIRNRARKCIEESYSVDKMVSDTEKIYDRLL